MWFSVSWEDKRFVFCMVRQISPQGVNKIPLFNTHVCYKGCHRLSEKKHTTLNST